ncbi:hypothetical protein FGO68_gene1402 [Halteria grandinella]|uniref:Transmembrane protein n=1 Tax=Halteria grandinella TaxID=5974 RepID=A0A8J8NT28_HALGN|nr:hypothetical protein FGO68_gene1402 [Halteria grandinella]
MEIQLTKQQLPSSNTLQTFSEDKQDKSYFDEIEMDESQQNSTTKFNQGISEKSHIIEVKGNLMNTFKSKKGIGNIIQAQIKQSMHEKILQSISDHSSKIITAEDIINMNLSNPDFETEDYYPTFKMSYFVQFLIYHFAFFFACPLFLIFMMATGKYNLLCNLGFWGQS